MKLSEKPEHANGVKPLDLDFHDLEEHQGS